MARKLLVGGSSHGRDSLRPRSRIQAKNEECILDAAEEVFADFGFRGTTMDQIAASADMSKPNVHYYFKRKSDIYSAVLQRVLNIWLSPFDELDVDRDPEQELSKYIKLKIEYSRKYPAASKVFASEILQGAPILQSILETDLKSLVERKIGVLNQWMEDGKLVQVEPYHLIFLIWAATQHYADFMPQIKAVTGKKKLSKKDFEAAESSICKIILRGILVDNSHVN